MFDIPQRRLLSIQVADAMRRALSQGIWVKTLPGERSLCSQFHVSRPTIRTALHVLIKEGLINVQRGRPTVITSSAKRACPPRNRRIVLVAHELFSRFSATTYHGIREMQAYLSKHGLECEIFICKTRGLAAQLHKLDDYIRHNSVVCSVLVTVQKEVQQWFAAKSLPALVLGSCHPSVTLPSFDVDYRSVCRHAAGVLHSKGHRRLALIVPGTQGPGDRASAEGFIEALAPLAQAGAAPIVVYHNGKPQNICSRLDILFASKWPPTALLVTNPKWLILVLTYLLGKGLHIPANISLIARDQDAIFTDLVPPISHYAFDIDVFTRRLARLILSLVDKKYLPPEPKLIFPRFVPGGTVRPLSQNPVR